MGDRPEERLALGAASGSSTEFQQAQGDRMARHAQGHRRSTGRDQIGDSLTPGQHQRQRTWPESLGQQLRGVGPIGNQWTGIFLTGDVDDDRIDGWPALGGEDLEHRLGIESVGAEAVDCFRGKSDQAAFAQNG